MPVIPDVLTQWRMSARPVRGPPVEISLERDDTWVTMCWRTTAPEYQVDEFDRIIYETTRGLEPTWGRRLDGKRTLKHRDELYHPTGPWQYKRGADGSASASMRNGTGHDFPAKIHATLARLPPSLGPEVLLEATFAPGKTESYVLRLEDRAMEALSQLKPTQQAIMLLRFGIGHSVHTTSEIADHIGITPSGVQMAEDKAIREMNRYIRTQLRVGFRPY